MTIQELIQKFSFRDRWQLYQHVLTSSEINSKKYVVALLQAIERAGALKEFQDYLIELHKPEYIARFYGKYFNEEQ